MGAAVTLVSPNPTTRIDQPVGTASNPMVMVGSDGEGGTSAGLPSGRAPAANCVPTVLSEEDFSALSPTGVSRIASAAATTNATVAKASAGKVFRVSGNNVKASVIYLKFANVASGLNPGTTAVYHTVPLSASSVFDKNLDALTFSTGISYYFTTDAADSGATALSAGDILNFALTYS